MTRKDPCHQTDKSKTAIRDRHRPRRFDRNKLPNHLCNRQIGHQLSPLTATTSPSI